MTGVAAVVGIVVTGSVWAQAPRQFPPAAYSAPHRPFPAPTPEDAYRQGLINRPELEQLAGPTAQALQGPSADGSREEIRITSDPGPAGGARFALAAL